MPEFKKDFKKFADKAKEAGRDAKEKVDDSYQDIKNR